MFQQGNKLGKGGPRPGSGRKPLAKTQIRRAEDAIDIVGILRKLEELALAGDVKAAIYLCDRTLGKPKETVDLAVPGGIKIEYSIGRGYASKDG